MNRTHRPFGRAHYEESLTDQITIAHLSYRFYIAPNVFVFGRAKVDWMRTKLADDIIAEQDRLALAILLNEYDDIREEWAPDAPDLPREELLMRYKRRRDELFGMHPPR